MKKKLAALAISAAFVLAVFSGCAAMRRTTNEIRGIDALDRSSDNLRNYLARSATDTADDNMPIDPYTVTSPYVGDGVTRAGRALTVDHIASLVGMNEVDVNTAFGSYYRENRTGSSIGRVYNHTMFGNPTDIDVSFNNSNRINQITVTASKSEAARWQRELNARYGVQLADGVNTGEWLADGARIRMQPYGNDVRIVFSNTL